MQLTEIRERIMQHRAELARLVEMEHQLLDKVFPIQPNRRSMLYHLEHMKHQHQDDPVLYEMILSEIAAQIGYLYMDQDKPNPLTKYSTREAHAIVDGGDYERLLAEDGINE